jgi:hypothetical protein
MAGAASGLFVGAHVGSSVAALTSQAFILFMMVAGAIGFYLGIDTPQMSFHPPEEGEEINVDGQIDSAEFLSAVGTFLAALTAFVSVGVIVLRGELHIVWTTLIMIGWVLGVAMQIVAGTMARVHNR